MAKPWTFAGVSASLGRAGGAVTLGAKHNILIFIDPIETAGWLQTLRNNGLTAANAGEPA